MKEQFLSDGWVYTYFVDVLKKRTVFYSCIVFLVFCFSQFSIDIEVSKNIAGAAAKFKTIQCKFKIVKNISVKCSDVSLTAQFSAKLEFDSITIINQNWTYFRFSLCFIYSDVFFKKDLHMIGPVDGFWWEPLRRYLASHLWVEANEFINIMMNTKI